ncbi:MAG: hypothetical protein ACRER5_02890 [Pseudomonas sp.]
MNNEHNAMQAQSSDLSDTDTANRFHVEIHISTKTMADLDEQLNEIRGRLTEGSQGGTNTTLNGGRYRFSTSGEMEPNVDDFVPFELTLPGFLGDTDETDDRVLWVLAKDEAAVNQAISGLDVRVWPLLPIATADVDFILPTQVDAMRKRIQALAQAEPCATRAAA